MPVGKVSSWHRILAVGVAVTIVEEAVSIVPVIFWIAAVSIVISLSLE